MVTKTRSQEEDPKGKGLDVDESEPRWFTKFQEATDLKLARFQEANDQKLFSQLSKFQEANDQKFSQLQAMIAELSTTRNQTNQPSEDQFTLDRSSTQWRKPRGSGSDHFERSGDDRWFSEEDRRFREYLMSRNDDDDETWTWTEHYSVMDDETDWWYRSEKEDHEDQSLDDGELVETEVVTESDGIEQQTVNNEENANENLDILKEEPISQLQVPVSRLEPSLRFHNVSPNVCEDFKSLVGFDGLLGHVKARAELVTKSTSVTNNQAAHQLFDKMSLRAQSKRRQIKCHKSWRFKFKHRVAPRDSKSGFEVETKQNLSKECPRWLLASNLTTLVHTLYEGEMKSNGCSMLLQLFLSVIQKKRQRKTPKYHKTWKFRFKNMELQRIMTQLDTQHFIFRWGSECILHLSTVVHHLETSHKQSSFAIDALKSDFGVDVIIFHGEQQFGCRVVMLHLKKRGTYEFSGQLQDSSNGEAESFPFLNFAAEQPLLWVQNNAEPILIDSEFEKKKQMIGYKTRMFKYKAPLRRRQFLHHFDKEVPIETNWVVQGVWDKDSPDVGITDAYYVLQEEFEQVENHTPCFVVKLERPQDHDALLLPFHGDERFQIKHKWRSKLLLSILELELYLDSLVLITSYATSLIS